MFLWIMGKSLFYTPVNMGKLKVIHYLIVIVIANSASARSKRPPSAVIFGLGQNDYPALRLNNYPALGPNNYPALGNNDYPALGLNNYPALGQNDYSSALGHKNHPSFGQLPNIEANYQDFLTKQDLTETVQNSKTPKSFYKRYLEQNNVICEVNETIEVFQEPGFEFSPSQYFSKRCNDTNEDPYKPDTTFRNTGIKPEICLHDDNHSACHTVYEDMRILKRNKNNPNSCWVHTTQLIPIGCRCNIRFVYNNKYN